MTQEEKQLLLKDLCARLPYKTYIEIVDEDGNIRDEVELAVQDIITVRYDESTSIHPYLRPMSSMTEEEKKMVCSMNGLSDTELNDRIEYPNMYVQNYTIETFDLFNAHHLDYRGLIEKGLALKAQKDMYEKL